MKKHEHPADGSQAVKTPPWQGLQLTLVQSTVCVLVLLCVLLLKMIGGDVYTDLVAQFRHAMTEDTLASAVATLGETVAAEEGNTATTLKAAATTTTVPTEGETKAVCAPLTGGVITSAFGDREDPFDASQSDTHYGVDIAADEGAVLFALMDGTVTEVGYEESGYGHYLIVSCGDTQSYLYAHCSRVDVQSGQSVKAGEAVALVGSTGRSTGSHLHFEWREGGTAVDPMGVLPSETYV